MKKRILVMMILASGGLLLGSLHGTIAQEEPAETETVETDTAETDAIAEPRIEDFDELAEICRTRSGEPGLDACDRALAINEQDSSIWINRGIKLDRDLADPYSAIESYYKAAQLDLDQNYSLAWFNQCAILLKIATQRTTGDSEKIRPLFMDLALLEAESTSATDLGLDPTLLYKAVLATCDRAITGDQDWGNASIARAWNNVGYAQDELGNFGLALEAYDAAIAIDPEHVGVWNNKAITLEKLSRPAEAIVAYEQALEIKPDYELARRNRARVLQNHPELRAIDPNDSAEVEASSETTEL